jgi:cold shock CspA family protein
MTTLTGCVKWFNNNLNYGFITVLTDGEHKNTDIFVHQSNIKTARDCFRTLYTGECVQFDMAKSDNATHPIHAVNVTGFSGGMLHCENPNYHLQQNRGGNGGNGGNGRGRGGNGRGRGGFASRGGNVSGPWRSNKVEKIDTNDQSTNAISSKTVTDDTLLVASETAADTTVSTPDVANIEATPVGNTDVKTSRGRGRGRKNDTA